MIGKIKDGLKSLLEWLMLVVFGTLYIGLLIFVIILFAATPLLALVLIWAIVTNIIKL